MTNPENSDDKFEYDGRLVFNGIYLESDDGTPFQSKESVLSELPEFEEGAPGNAGSGFQDLQLSDWAERYEELPDENQEVISNIWDVEFIHEVYQPGEDLVDSQGDPVEGYVADEWSAYVYWYPGDFLIIQASQSKLDDVEEQLFPIIGRTNFETNGSEGSNDSDEDDDDDDDGNGGNGSSPHEGLFDPEFLQWIVWKYDTLGGPSRFGVERLSDASMSGNLSYFGKSNEVSDSRDITSSHPIIAGMLENRNFDDLEGVFEVHGHKVDAQIHADGSIRVMAQEDVGDASQFERALLANLFLQRFLEEYMNWRASDPDEKYVDPKYFHELHEHAKDMEESANYDFDFDSLVRHYADLRNEDPRNYSFQFDT